jgi:putative phosphoesterase
MTKILILSDSHGHIAAIGNAVRRTEPDLVVFLGDCVEDVEEARKGFPGIPVRAVRGNCDPRSDAPEHLVLEIDGARVFAAHGHAQGVKMSLLRLALAAGEAGCSAALFGHTHLAYKGEYSGVRLFNPGALCDGHWLLLEADDGLLRAADEK